VRPAKIIFPAHHLSSKADTCYPSYVRISTSLLAAVLAGAVLGLATYTFVYAQGAAYLTNDPAACVNCHVMNGQYEGWLKSSHRNAAVCNDCHAPAGFAAKYFTKALNGFNHSLAFTTGRFPDNIQINARNLRVTNESCRQCHGELTHAIADTRCTTCHRNVGHLH
jgi:cytochrome c nitrite reductase small subunit